MISTRPASQPAPLIPPWRRFARLCGRASCFLLLTQLLFACSLRSPTPTPAATSTPMPPTSASPGLPIPSGSDKKVDTILLDVASAYKTGGSAAAEQKAKSSGLLNNNNELRLTLILKDNNTQPVADKVKSMGGKVTNVADNQLDILVPLDVLFSYVSSNGSNFVQDLASFQSVKEVQVTRKPQNEGFDFPPGTTIGAIQAELAAAAEEGVQVSGADKWQQAGIKGQGVKVGIIDGGFEGYESLLGKELPQKVNFKSFLSDGGIGDGVHGTAVAEIVHAMAPEAEIYLCPIDSSASYSNAVKYLVDQVGVKVIQQSQGWHDTRGDGTGFRADLVNYARSKGVLFVKSAGNEGDSHYTATFAPDGSGLHQYAPGRTQLQVAGSDEGILLYFTWDAWTGDPVNYDLYLVDQSGNVVTSSRNVQGPDKPPFEWIYYQGSSSQKYYVVIRGVGNPRPVRMDLFGKNTELQKVTTETSTPAGSISNPGDAAGAFTVGAVNVTNGQLEDFSSQGPTLDGRTKPDISGLDAVTTTAYQGQPFYGTSAACPHVSGAAALVFSAQPNATPDQVAAFLQQHAKDMQNPGPDNETGYGELQLGPPEQAQTAVGGTQPANPTPIATTVAVTGGNGPAFTDTFADPSSGLPNTGEGQYSDSKYVLTPNAPNRAVWATYGNRYTNATIEVTVAFAGGAAGTAGIVFWQSSPDDYYLFSVTPDDYYQVAHYQGGQWTKVMPWAQNDVIGTGPVTLQVQTNGAAITATANGTALGTVQAPAAGQGKPGMLVAVFGGNGLAAGFRNFKVTPGP
jgi:subtilisin family serine protease